MHNITNYSVPMIDGLKGGIGLDKVSSTELGIEVSQSDFAKLRKVIFEVGGVETKNSVSCSIRSKGKKEDNYTKVTLICILWRGRYFFNVDGNPISFLTGQNVLGTSKTSLLVRSLFLTIEETLEDKIKGFRFPASIWKAVDNLNIFVNRLAFACYTPELELKDWKKVDRLIRAIDFIYTANAELLDTSVKDYLGFKVVKEGSYSIRFEKKALNTTEWSLSLYNKAEELGVNDAPEWTKSRLRLDLTLHRTWFTQAKCGTLKDLEKKAGGDNYSTWAYHLFAKFLQETKLQYFLGFDIREEELDMGPYRKQFKAWRGHRQVELTPTCIDWFLEQGLDLTIPLNIHAAVGVAKSSFFLANGKNDTAVLGDRQAQKRVSADMFNSLRNSNDFFLPIAKRAHLLTPDTTFGRFTREKTKNGLVWVDTSTGEILT